MLKLYHKSALLNQSPLLFIFFQKFLNLYKIRQFSTFYDKTNIKKFLKKNNLNFNQIFNLFDKFRYILYTKIMIAIRRSWYDLLKDEFGKQYFLDLQDFLKNEYANYIIYPEEKNIFNALNAVPFDKVKVVIIGQDPYHEPRQAQGMSFSVPEDVDIPPSLVNIMREIESDLGVKCEKNGNLTRWAKQGVLLLNTVLTVRKGMANSHKDKGWERLTRKIIEILGQRKEPIVFLLWGSYAQGYQELIAPWHLVLKAPHPSPLSAYRGFFGCKHFSKCNQFLIEHGQTPIDWR